MSSFRCLALAAICLVGLPAIAQDAEPMEVFQAKVKMRRRQRRPYDHFSLTAQLPPGAALQALRVPTAEYDLSIGGRSVYHMSERASVDSYRQIKPGVWRLRFGRLFRIRLDTNTGDLKIKTRPLDLAHLRESGFQEVDISVRFADLEHSATVDLEERGRDVWRYRAPAE